MFANSTIKQLQLETSSNCNAACPMCPREYSPLFNKETDGRSLSLSKIKTLFDTSVISGLDSMFMCGNYGDPAAAPDTIKIYNYFREVNPSIDLGMHSNGGLRSTKWWSELGAVLSRPSDYCYFSVDGLADTNHIYRVNTKFDKIMKNATSFIQAGGQARWEYLVFAHNEHQVDEARALATEMGFVDFRTKISRRFNWVPSQTIKAPVGKQFQ